MSEQHVDQDPSTCDHGLAMTDSGIDRDSRRNFAPRHDFFFLFVISQILPQGKFWAYHDLLYANAPKAGPEHLKAFAQEVVVFSPDQSLGYPEGIPQVLPLSPQLVGDQHEEARPETRGYPGAT